LAFVLALIWSNYLLSLLELWNYFWAVLVRYCSWLGLIQEALHPYQVRPPGSLVIRSLRAHLLKGLIRDRFLRHPPILNLRLKRD
jgi:hypothetical protein